MVGDPIFIVKDVEQAKKITVMQGWSNGGLLCRVDEIVAFVLGWC